MEANIVRCTMTSRRRFQILSAFQNARLGWLVALCLSTGIAFAQTGTPAATEQSRPALEAGLGAGLDAAERETKAALKAKTAAKAKAKPKTRAKKKS